MKKLLIVIVLIISISLGAFVGYYISNQNVLEEREIKSKTLISFTISGMEDLKKGYDADTMESVISYVYAAREFTDDVDLYAALHELWNALIFDGENIVGIEDDLIKALKDTDQNVIKELAMSMRLVN